MAYGNQIMRLLIKLTIATSLFIVAGCSSRLDEQLLTCADFESSQITKNTAMKRLGLTSKHTKHMSDLKILDVYCDVLDWFGLPKVLTKVLLCNYLFYQPALKDKCCAIESLNSGDQCKTRAAINAKYPKCKAIYISSKRTTITTVAVMDSIAFSCSYWPSKKWD